MEEVKPGRASTELGATGVFLGLATAAYQSSTDWRIQALALVCATLAVLGYQWRRTQVKVAAEKRKAATNGGDVTSTTP